MVPRVPETLVVDEVVGADLHIVDDAAEGCGDGGGVVEGAEGILVYVEAAGLEEAADLVGEAGPEADDAGGEVYGEGHRRDIDLGEEFYLVHCLFF